MKKNVKKFLALLLSGSMLINVMNMAVWADEVKDVDGRYEISLSKSGSSNMESPAAGEMNAVKYAELVDAEEGIAKITMDITATPITRTEGIDVVFVIDESNSMNMFRDTGSVSLCFNEDHWYGLDEEWVEKLYPETGSNAWVNLASASDAWDGTLYFQLTDELRYTISSEWKSHYADDIKSVIKKAIKKLDVSTEYIDWDGLSEVFGGSGYWDSGDNHYALDDGEYVRITPNDNDSLDLDGGEYGCSDRITIEKNAVNKFVQDLMKKNETIATNAYQMNQVAYVGFAHRNKYENHGYTLFCDFTEEYEQLEEYVLNTDTRGYTSWAYGLNKAVSFLRERNDKTRPTYIIFMSDGVANSDGAPNWDVVPETEATKKTDGKDLPQLKYALAKAAVDECDSFYAIKYNVDENITSNGVKAADYFNLVSEAGAIIKECDTADKIDQVLNSIKGEIYSQLPSGTLTDVIGDDVILIENSEKYPITKGYTKTVENEDTILSWKFENVEEESVSFYVKLNDEAAKKAGTYLTNKDFEDTTGANLVYKKLSIDDSSNEVVKEDATVSMESPELTVKEVFAVKYEYTGLVPENAPIVPIDDNYYAEGENVDVKDSPSLEGYVFSGWDTTVLVEGTKMPGQDIVLKGSWQAIETDPEPTDPEPTDPEPTDPEPTDPEPTDSEPTTSNWVDDDDDEPETTVPSTTIPETSAPALETTPVEPTAPTIIYRGVEIPQEIIDQYPEYTLDELFDMGVLGAYFENIPTGLLPATGVPLSGWSILAIISAIGLAILTLFDKKRKDA